MDSVYLLVNKYLFVIFLHLICKLAYHFGTGKETNSFKTYIFLTQILHSHFIYSVLSILFVHAVGKQTQ